jgi:RNA polymerase sigma-70 factor, ECF subfamily
MGMTARSEGELILEGQRGDRAAISELLGRHYPYCLRLAFGVLRCEEESRDAVQSAMFSAFRHLSDFRGGSTFKTWLTRIVMNQCLMHLRQPQRRVSWVDVDTLYESGEANLLASPSPTPERLTFGTEISAAVADAASRLPEHLHQVFVLHHDAGMTLKEVAGTLGLSLSGAKTRMFRAHTRVRSQLQPVWRQSAL